MANFRMNFSTDANYKEDIGNSSAVENNSFMFNFHNHSSLYDYDHDPWWFFNLFLVKLDLFLTSYVEIVIAIIAVISNAIVVYVLTTKKNRYFSTSVFITNLAVADGCLGFAMIKNWLIANNYLEGAYSDIDCKLRGLVPRACGYISRWMLATLSIERALCVKIPHKVKNICTLNFARCLVITLWILAVSKASLYSSMLEYMPSNCFVFLDEYKYLYWVDLCLYVLLSAVIPFTIIITCTIIILLTLARSGIRKSKSNKSQVRSISITLLIVNVAFLILVSPTVSFDMYTIIRFTVGQGLWTSPKSYYEHIAMLNIFSFLSNINNAVNFFIYFLSGSRFRKETKDCFLSCKNSFMNK